MRLPNYIIWQIHFSLPLSFGNFLFCSSLYSGIQLLGGCPASPKPGLVEHLDQSWAHNGRLRSRSDEAWPKSNRDRGAIDNDVLSSASLSSVSPATEVRRCRAQRVAPCDPHQ